MMIVPSLFTMVLIALSCFSVRAIDDEFQDKNALFIETYAQEHTDAIRLPSGLIYRILKEGGEDAAHIVLDQACLVRYTGTTITGEVFTSSLEEGQAPSEIVPSKLSLSGWREALSFMKAGDHWEVVLPAHLAYGSKTKGKHVKPDATLILDLEVESATVTSKPGMSLFTRQALGVAFMVAYGLYMTYESKKKISALTTTLKPKDVYNKSSNSEVFLKVAVGNSILPRIEIELFSSVCPKTAENFRCLCTGEKGMCPTQPTLPLHLKDSVFHRIIPGFMLQGGDITARDGTGGWSIYGETFEDEWGGEIVTHSEPYLLSMANCGANTNGSQFFITTAAVPRLDRKHVVFGRVKRGFEAVKAMEAAGSPSGGTSKLVRIIDCGEVKVHVEDKKKK